ncbi:MAG: hypothetical protein NXI08_01975 [bacterium]|nr:hypothetical protein [bacterium]
MNRIPLRNQVLALRSYFKEAELSWTRTSLKWVHTITPTPLSKNYKLKLTYKIGKGVDVYVIDPKKLPLATGKKRLPHVYSQEKQELCLYYPSAEERERKWFPDMYIVKTIVPWAIEWLEFYEYWLGSGKWFGGGIHPNGEREEYDFGSHKKTP